MNEEKIIEIGKKGMEMLLKYPHINTAERQFYEEIALLGKLAEKGQVAVVTSAAEVDLLQSEIRASSQ